MTKDMTTGPITPLLVNFTIPLVLGNLFQLTYNAVDSIIVGKFVGEDALAAVGTSNPLMTLAILFINGVCLGAGILVSLAFGAGDTELVERQVSTTAIAGSVFSLVFSLTCVILANPLLRLLQVPEEILPIAALDLVKALAGLIVQLHQRDAAARVGGAQHIGSGQIRFCHNKHGLHILVDGSGGQLVQHQRTGYGLGRAGNDALYRDQLLFLRNSGAGKPDCQVLRNAF